MVVQLAGCVIHDKKGRVLLIHRNTERLVQWELPGGKLEPGETLAEAAIREAQEEIGVSVRIERELGTANFIDNGTEWEYHWFVAMIEQGAPVIGEPDRFDGIDYFDLFDAGLDMNTVSINVTNLIRAIKNEQVQL
jgi:8-oxo-dGTP diphosphatase